MKITPVASHTEIKQTTTANSDARARAIEAFVGSQKPQAQETAVIDPNNISPEEMSAVVQPTIEAQEAAPIEETVDNSTSIEDTEPKKDPEVEKQFLELSRQERVIRARVQKQTQELKAREDALAAKEEELKSKYRLDETKYISKDRLKEDPLGVLSEAELSYDDLTQRMINAQPRDPRTDAMINRLEAKIKSLEEASENTQKSVVQQQEESYKAAIKQLGVEATKLVAKDPEAYEAISKTNSVREVVKLIEDTYQKDGILLSVEEAAQEVENYIVEQGLNKLSKIEKIKKRLAESSAAVTTQAKQVNTETQAKPQQTQMKTLTNANSGTKKISSRERAILAFKGELKG